MTEESNNIRNMSNMNRDVVEKRTRYLFVLKCSVMGGDVFVVCQNVQKRCTCKCWL